MSNVKVSLRRTYGYQGTYYGPGDCEVPQGLADALGLSPNSPDKPVSEEDEDSEDDSAVTKSAAKSGAKKK